ncbi:DUF1616 domain-containing protein [Halorarius halobius]|uniref:DUF1616 domain-containing protein n=1 Tax=Halorarius halobius TaxID=2962671 RepID=UPI0020CD81FB|nr:DUF1616 domain-containing protein [Halorarius halobius]
MDYLGVLGFVLVTDALLVSFPRTATPVRLLVGAPLLLFFPGYTLLGALYPRARDARRDPHGRETAAWGPTLTQRLALSVATSVALVPLLALALQFADVGYDAGSVLSVLSVAVVGFTLAAGLRRARVPQEQRFRLPIRSGVGRFRAWLAGPSQVDAALNAMLAVAVLLAVAATGFAFVAPAEGESYTQVSLLTEQGDELVAGGYPTELTFGESASVVSAVENHQGRTVSYTAVVVLQQVDTDGGEPTVVRQQELDRAQATVAAGETWQVRHDLTPRTTGTDLRLTYLLFVGDAPANPSVENAHRHLYLWVDVEGPGGVEPGG